MGSTGDGDWMKKDGIKESEDLLRYQSFVSCWIMTFTILLNYFDVNASCQQQFYPVRPPHGHIHTKHKCLTIVSSAISQFLKETLRPSKEKQQMLSLSQLPLHKLPIAIQLYSSSWQKHSAWHFYWTQWRWHQVFLSSPKVSRGGPHMVTH